MSDRVRTIRGAITVSSDDGDEVLVPDPYYATYEGLVAASGATFVPVQTAPEAGFHLTPEGLEAAITPKTKVLHFCHITNLTGQIFPVQNISRMARSRRSCR